jgi:hypothetical protein
MMKKILSMLSLGERYLFAACFYFGLSLVLISMTPKFPTVLAYTGCGGEQICQDGETCCGGVCCSGVCQDGVCCKSGKYCNGKCVDAGAECCTDRELTLKPKNVVMVLSFSNIKNVVRLATAIRLMDATRNVVKAVV